MYKEGKKGGLVFRVQTKERKFRHWNPSKLKEQSPGTSSTEESEPEGVTQPRKVKNGTTSCAKRSSVPCTSPPARRAEKQKEHKRRQHDQLFVLFHDPSQSNVDPFRVLGQEKTPGVDIALHHWTIRFHQTRIPITPRSDWIQASLSNPTLFKAAIASSTAHILNLQGPGNILNIKPFLQQKNDAIVAINRDLAIPNLIPSDQLIMAVSAMAIIECLGGTPRSCAIHMQGVSLLVKTRGGLEVLGINGLCKRTVSWADTLTAMTLNRKPLFHPILEVNAGETAWPSPLLSPAAESLHKRLLNMTSSATLTIAITHIYARLQQLSIFLNTESNAITEDRYLVSDKFDALERQIIAVLTSSALSSFANAAIVTAFLNAAYIFIIRCFREVPTCNAVCIHVFSRIVNGLKDFDIVASLEDVPDLVVWTLLVGRIGTPLPWEAMAFFEGAMESVERSLSISVPEKLMAEQYFQVAGMAAAIVEKKKSRQEVDEHVLVSDISFN